MSGNEFLNVVIWKINIGKLYQFNISRNAIGHGSLTVVELSKGEEGGDRGNLSVGSIFQLKQWVLKVEVMWEFNPPIPRQFEP